MLRDNATPAESTVEKCVACESEPPSGTFWNEMRLCSWCGSEFMDSPEMDAAQAERNQLSWEAPEPVRFAPYQKAARVWLQRQRKSFGLEAAA